MKFFTDNNDLAGVFIKKKKNSDELKFVHPSSLFSAHSIYSR